MSDERGVNGSEGAAEEDGVSEAEAEATIAAIVEAERAAEAEEAAVAEAEEAAELEEPEDEAEVEAEAEAEAEAAPVAAKKPAATSSKPRAASSKAAKPVTRKLAVLGSPIEHSKSPALHRAAYDVLGLDWEYDAVDVTADDLTGFIDGLGPEWRGLSLTMPLKKSVVPVLGETDRIAEQTGAANTVLLDDGVVRGFNTDVPGFVRALSAAGLESAHFVHILGGGATAASALVAAAELGAEKVDIYVRSLERSVWLEPLAHQLGLMVRIRPLSQADRSLDVPDLVISTLPGGATTDALYTDSTRRKAVLFDVSYDPWPSALGRSWNAVGGHVVSGLALLAHQALLQVRIFVSGDPLQPLDGEETVLAAMLDAVGIDAAGALLED
ncbi:shikimate dehydrogenase [Leifsonia sp. PS1209]|uniref:shikimate dehydrogenase n=1 Tax=Leifsonia sp. PS1209 TaxID=2724914 RepID=UPI001442DE29|nr:shikimate dehydrogenase [Leifsonia sp. PS1209]QIZ98955.1 shikimate dehydrogenase [Leifsonia sp. PS1209]